MRNSENRAVSALFRACGDGEVAAAGEAGERSAARGMHLGEYRVLATLIPLTMWVAIGGTLSGVWGATGWLTALPIAFVAMNLLPFVFGVKSQAAQWWVVLIAAVIWAVVHRQSTGVVGLFSHVWIGVGIMSFCGWLIIGWRVALGWSGKWGIAWRIFAAVLLHGIAFGLGWQFGWSWAVLGGALLGAAFCRITFDPGCQAFGPIYQTVMGEGILITIDDGPDPKDTPMLLDILDRHGVKAVFFMIGKKVKAHPELAREVVRRGHEIGNHTMTHPQATFWGTGPGRTRREIEGCQKVVREVTGITPQIFRAPCGHRNWFTHPISEDLGLDVMAWSLRGYDAVETDLQKVLARIVPHLAAGDIVLLHEATPIASDLLSGVLDAMAVKGLKSVTPTDLC